MDKWKMFPRLCLLLLCCTILPSLVCCQICNLKSDIVFVLDASTAVPLARFNEVQLFVNNFVNNFNVGPNDAQFAAVAYSSAVRNLFFFSDVKSHGDISQRIINASLISSGEATEQVLNHVLTKTFSSSNGARANATKIVVVFTYGKLNNPGGTRLAAQGLTRAGATIMAVGIGDNDDASLNAIASSPDNVLKAETSVPLLTLTVPFLQNLCSTKPAKNTSDQGNRDCDAQADILLILDSSSSIGSGNYDKMLRFVANLTHTFDIGPKAIQFGAIIFGYTAKNLFKFGQYTDHQRLESALLSAPYLSESTNTEAALNFARLQSFTSVYGARASAAKIAIVLTDGASNAPVNTSREAKLLKNSGVLVLSIGIGTNFNRTELLAIASTPADVFEVTNFNILNTISKQVTNKTCEEVVTPPKQVIACDAQADVLFILDSSSSINRTNYNKMLNFVVNVTRNFNIGPNAIQFASIVFGNNASLVFDFTKYTDHIGLEEGLLKSPYLAQNSFIDRALVLARELAFTTTHGARLNVPWIAIVVTDGLSSQPAQTLTQAQLLKNSGVRLLSVGIGDSVVKSELETMSTFPTDALTVDTFDLLDQIEPGITNKTCEEVIAPQNDSITCNITQKADIVFILDSSGSIKQDNYNLMLNFVVNITRNFNIGPNEIQFASIIFGENAEEVFDFRKYTNHTALEKGILTTKYLDGWTYTDKALNFAREHMFTAAKGSRAGVPKIAIVFTDGQSNYKEGTEREAMLLKNSSVQVMSIGIGTAVNQDELLAIASSPQLVFQVINFNVLNTIYRQVTNKTCQQVTSPSVVTTPAECPAVADILFIMDSTGSISKENYNTMLTFIANFTRIFAVGPKGAQFSGITFGDRAHSEFSFTKYNTHAELEKGILNATYFGETTQTDLALKLAREHSFTSANGARTGVDKVAIVLTDGRSNDPNVTAQEAKLLKDSGVLVLTIAIGLDVLERELEAIATLPEDVFHVDHFDALEAIGKVFAKQACDRVTRTVECEAQADVLFILDSSASIGTFDFEKMLGFVANITRHFNLGPNAVQFSAISCGDDARLEFDFGRYNNHPSLEQGLFAIKYLAQNTYTNKALLLARQQAFTAAHGARGNVSKIAIVITDGQSSLPTETFREAQLLKTTGILVLSVGIGSDVKQSELEAIASAPSDVFQVNNFAVLNTIQKSLTNKTCEKVTESLGCSQLADIIFLLDSSGSVSTDNYLRQLMFASNFTDNFQIGASNTRFGAVVFSDNATKLFDLDDLSDHWSISQALLFAPHLKGGTNTAGALDMIFTEGLFTPRGGGREKASKLLVIMTDGQSANLSTTIASAQRLKTSGVHIMTIGVGDVVNVDELKGMATTPNDVFHAINYQSLQQLLAGVTNHTCGYTKPSVTVPRTCSEKADIIFIVDSSSSITVQDYQKQLAFASNVSQEFEIGPVDAHFAALVFSNDVFKVFDLGAFSDHLNLYHGLLTSPHLTGTADIGKALNWVSDVGMFGPAFGGRDNTSKVIILFASNPSVDQARALLAADRLKTDGVHIVAVGIDNYDLYELRQIASKPASVFRATSADALQWIQRNLVDDICDFAITY